MLKLVCGSSGAGKTTLLTALVRADLEKGIRCLLLVPEQQAYISERDFPKLLPSNAGLFFEIIHFTGLAEDVFRKYGGITQKSVDHGLRTLMMWETLRETAPLLKQYGQSIGNDTAFPSMMLRTVTELHTNGINSDLLEETATKLPANSSLQKKLSDLALVDATFHGKMELLFGEDPMDKLDRLAQKLEEHRYFEGCHVFVDSFAGFTVQEYRVLGEILKQAAEVTVFLCTDSFRSSLPHFDGAVQTARRLCKLAQEANTSVEMTELPPPSEEKRVPALRMLERDLWRFELKREDRQSLTDEEKDAIRLIRCTNLYEEAECAALSILELVQSGMHYGDIAVVVRDAEVYRGVLDTAFERYGIPYFLSERTDFSSKPLAKLIFSALRAVQKNYPLQDIITLLKTGLVGVSGKDAALFEEYCETWHISGNRFFDAIWNMNPDGLTTERSPRANVILEAANRTRSTVMTSLQMLSAELKASKHLKDRCRALYDYLCRLDIRGQLVTRAEQELAAGQRRQASETLRLYESVIDALTTLSTILPDTELSIEEFINALTLFFSETDMGSVPHMHDCVIIGSAPMLRVENIRASLLLGLCEGEFPSALSDDGILTESDKIALEEFGISFDSRENRRSCEELLYVYRAMTKPKKNLFLFTSAMQTDGSARTPSLAFNRVAYLLDRKPESFDSSTIMNSITSTQTVDTEWKILPRPTGSTLSLSQSRIKAFVLCPYRYYSSYVLNLREPKSSLPSYADDGTFLHHIFECYLRRALCEDGTLRLLSPKETEALTDEIIEHYLTELCPLSPDRMDPRMLHQFARLRKLALRMLTYIIEELRVSLFCPSRFEQSIGLSGDGALPAVELILKDGSRVLLRGKIDRVDLYDDGKHLYVRVVDYKSGSHSRFSLEDVRSGVDLQLVLYLYALLASDSRMRGAGAQYFYSSTENGEIRVDRSGFLLDEDSVREAADRSPDQTFTKKLVKYSAQQIEDLQEDMKETVCSIAQRILDGEAQKTPSEDACTLCPIRKNCDQAYHK